MTGGLRISLRAVSVRRGRTWALRDVSLDFAPGERWALTGPNGSGKTQLLKLLGTDVWPTPTGRETLEYRDGGRRLDVAEAKLRVAYVGAELQDKYDRYGWNPTVAELLATGLHRSDLLLRAVTAGEQRRVERMQRECRLTRLRGRRFLSLSYGQRKLALLARALIGAPDWLLLDEFYNGLDVEFRQRIDALLAAAAARGQSWVAAAHRAADVPAGTRGLVELAAGRVCRVTRLRRRDVAALAAAAGEGMRAQRTAPSLARPPRSGKRGPMTRSGRRSPACPPRAPRRVLLRLVDADLYVDYRRVLGKLNWELREREHWAVFGSNGAGKSSFLKLLYGDLSPALGGRIEREGRAAGTPIVDWKRRVGFVSPELQTDYSREATVAELVMSGRYASIGLLDGPTAADRAAARRWLDALSLSSVAARRVRELSYGQLRRALIARALAGSACILLLDEPFTGLDPRQRSVMKRLLERLMKRRVTVVMAVHHAEDLPRGIGNVLKLEKGRAIVMDAETAT